MSRIYLDHNATTPLDPRVWQAMQPYFHEAFGNPSSLSQSGRLARAGIDHARQQVAALVGAHPSQVIFTSGGSEANNLALKGCVLGEQLRRVAWSVIEHPSVRAQQANLRRLGCDTSEIAVDASGQVTPELYRRHLQAHDPQLVSVMLANNETGVIQDIAALSAAAPNVIFHTDAVQAAGKIEVDFERLGVRLLSLSSHKIYGPKGAGALIVDKRLGLEPLIHGGGHERGLRAGTENAAAIVGFGMAAELAFNELASRREKLLELRAGLERGLKQIEGAHIFAEHSPRLPNTSFFGFDGIDGEALVLQLDAAGFAVTSGSACSSKSGKPSHVLLAMGVDEAVARTAVRVSLGQDSSKKDVDDFLDYLSQHIPILRRTNAAW